MKPWLRHSLGMSLLAGLGTVFSVPGCGKQNEGERCDHAHSGNADCESGLVCVDKRELVNGDADRCCPESTTPTDDRCLPSGVAGTGGTAGDSGVDGAAGAAGANTDGSTDVSSDVSSEGGDAADGAADGAETGKTCHYSSECLGTLVCGPTGVCQAECMKDKDCPSGETCTLNVCEPLPVDSGAD